ncbi:hypothetical protein LINPERPRIM_LOCUS7614 [Linum perenne]
MKRTSGNGFGTCPSPQKWYFSFGVVSMGHLLRMKECSLADAHSQQPATFAIVRKRPSFTASSSVLMLQTRGARHRTWLPFPSRTPPSTNGCSLSNTTMEKGKRKKRRPYAGTFGRHAMLSFFVTLSQMCLIPWSTRRTTQVPEASPTIVTIPLPITSIALRALSPHPAPTLAHRQVPKILGYIATDHFWMVPKRRLMVSSL